jgi:hypothetical protein
VLAGLAEAFAGFQQMLRVEAGLDPLGEFYLVGSVEQRRLPDSVEIHPHQVCGGALGIQIAINPTCGGICHIGLLLARAVICFNA